MKLLIAFIIFCFFCNASAKLSRFTCEKYQYWLNNGQIIIADEKSDFLAKNGTLAGKITTLCYGFSQQINEVGKVKKLLLNQITTLEADPFVKKYSSQFNIDPLLIHSIIQVESRYNTNAVSPKNAKGLMQLMPIITEHYGVTDAFNIEQNIKAGTSFFASLLKQYNSVDKALIHYNAGGKYVDDDSLPKSIKEYVYKVNYYWSLAKQQTNNADYDVK